MSKWSVTMEVVADHSTFPESTPEQTAAALATRSWPDDYPPGLPYAEANKYDAMELALQHEFGLTAGDADAFMSLQWPNLDLQTWDEPPARLLSKERGGDL